MQGQLQLADLDLQVSTVITVPEEAKFVLVLAHGAGAGMHHRFLEEYSQALAALDVATLRYQFPYMESGRRFPDPPKKLIATCDAAITYATTHFKEMPIFAGGKSMGGRMTSQWAAANSNSQVTICGIVFLGFPLHPPGKPGTSRADHLGDVQVPMLFLQGTRDKLATPDLLKQVFDGIATRHAIEWIDTGDHSFKVLKSSRLDQSEVISLLALKTRDWMMAVTAS